jgi:hypothetical protein
MTKGHLHSSHFPAGLPHRRWPLATTPAPTWEVIGDPAVPATFAAVLEAAEPRAQHLQGPLGKAPAWERKSCETGTRFFQPCQGCDSPGTQCQ